MHAKIFSATTVGIDARIVTVEIDLSLGLAKFNIVGLPNTAIKESKDRIRAALKNSGLRIPPRAITVNLAPANLKKQEILFDLPIAVAMLQAAGLLAMSSTFVNETLFLGELSLDGSVCSICGVLAIAHAASKKGKKRLIIPQGNVQEARFIEGVEVVGVSSMVELVAYLRGERRNDSICRRIVMGNKCPLPFESFHIVEQHNGIKKYLLDFNQVKGQWQAKRALQIAAAGFHNVLFIGPPGAGKTMLAKRLISILPSMTRDEIIEVTKVYSIVGLLKKRSLITSRPFRAPHHTISQAGLVGGGTNPRPGEISLAHKGVLFLDELTEFNCATLEALRQPLESGQVFLSRANISVEYPCAFLLVVALNPCPCGYYGDKHRECFCTPQQIAKYLKKLSGPLIDRIDLQVQVRSIEYSELADEVTGNELYGKSSSEIKETVDRAVEAQKRRSGCVRNAQLRVEQIEKYCLLSKEAEKTVRMAFEKLHLSMRGYHKVLKISRTIADIEGAELIERAHVQEAIMYRLFDQKRMGFL